MASSMINDTTEKGVRRAGKGQEDELLPLLALPLTMKIKRKEVAKAWRSYNKMNHMDKSF